MAAIDITLTSGGTIAQGVASRNGSKTLAQYRDAAAVLFLDDADFKQLDIMRGMPVRVSNEFGEIVVYCEPSKDGPHPGIGFIPRGPWMNSLTNPATYSSGCAHYKETPATVEPAPVGERPLTVPELMRRTYILGK